jgi:Recombination endonuclease VII
MSAKKVYLEGWEERRRLERARKRREGICLRHDTCTAMTVSGKSLCQKHENENAARNKAMYQRRLKSGLCVDCMKRPRKKGITRCEECSSYHSGLVGKHGATIEDRRRLLAQQFGKCAICDRPIDTLANIDHDHLTGEIRGLLCGRCNKAIGWFGDDPELLGRAMVYLDPREWIGGCI